MTLHRSPSAGREFLEQEPTATTLEKMSLRLMNDKQAEFNVDQALRNNAYTDMLREQANTQAMNIEMPNMPIDAWSETLIGLLGKYGFPLTLEKKFEALLTPLTKEIGKGNYYVVGKSVNADRILKEVRFLESLTTLTDVQRGYVRSVRGLLNTVMNRQIHVEDGMLKHAIAGTNTVYGKAARGREQMSNSPHATFVKEVGKQSAFLLAAGFGIFGIGITLRNIQRGVMDPTKFSMNDIFNGPLVKGSIAAYMIANAPALLAPREQAVASEAGHMATPDVKAILRHYNIAGKEGGDVFDLLTDEFSRKARRTYLDAKPEDEKARSAFLEELGVGQKKPQGMGRRAEDILRAMAPADLRRLVSAAHNVTNKDAQEFARIYITERGFDTPFTAPSL